MPLAKHASHPRWATALLGNEPQCPAGEPSPLLPAQYCLQSFLGFQAGACPRPTSGGRGVCALWGRSWMHLCAQRLLSLQDMEPPHTEADVEHSSSRPLLAGCREPPPTRGSPTGVEGPLLWLGRCSDSVQAHPVQANHSGCRVEGKPGHDRHGPECPWVSGDVHEPIRCCGPF